MLQILSLTNAHREDVLSMMRVFYASPAVATGSQVADRLLVVLDILLILALAGLDVLVYRYRLHHRPGHAILGNHCLALLDLLHGPYLAVGNVVQGMNNIRCACLTDVCERYGVIRTVPTP